MTLHPDPLFLFLSPENEFRGELLNQRWTCGEKISSCEGATSLHGTHIKVRRKPSVLHDRVLFLYRDPLLHALTTGRGPCAAPALLDQVVLGEWSLSGTQSDGQELEVSVSLLQLNLLYGESGQRGLPAVKIWLRVQIFKSFPSSLVPSFKDGSDLHI